MWFVVQMHRDNSSVKENLFIAIFNHSSTIHSCLLVSTIREPCTLMLASFNNSCTIHTNVCDVQERRYERVFKSLLNYTHMLAKEEKSRSVESFRLTMFSDFGSLQKNHKIKA